MEQNYKGWSILVDCDGCLTNGQKIVDATGQRQMIAFHSRDSIACKMLVEMGFRVIVLTHSGFRGISEYWHKHGAFTFFAGGGDPKSNKLAVTSVHQCIDWEKTIGIGDDVTDICYLEKCRYAICPSDAHREVQKHPSTWITESIGGNGILSELHYEIKTEKLILQHAEH